MATPIPAGDTGLISRAIRASRLEQGVYEEVEADTTATTQAAIVVAVGAVAAGIGAGIGTADLVGNVLGGIVSGLIGWVVYAYVAFLVGTTILKAPTTKADWGEVARTLGFANAPRALLVLGVVPGSYQIISLVVAIWVLIATIIGLRAALDVSTGRAVAVAIVSVIALIVVTAVVAGFVAALTPG